MISKLLLVVNAHLFIGFVGSYTMDFFPARILRCINRQDDEGEKILKFDFELVSCI